MKISTTVMFKHTIFAPKGRIFHEKFSEEYERVLGEEVEVRLSGLVLRFYEHNINTFDDTAIEWEDFLDRHLTPLTVEI